MKTHPQEIYRLPHGSLQSERGARKAWDGQVSLENAPLQAGIVLPLLKKPKGGGTFQ